MIHDETIAERIEGRAENLFRLFVYGTLKRGYWNHEAYCRSAVSVEEATVRGRLYELPSGYPVLEVPECDIITHGSADILSDLARQCGLGAYPPGYPECDGENWQLVEGELITLPDPERTLPPIDRLEGFHPGGESLYLRVLVPVRTSGERVEVVWCYVTGSATARIITPTFLNRWG
jgi:gamma-glutamylcyclotransferase (GGCT)/AIG2-like uncharacterized protein YtfP